MYRGGAKPCTELNLLNYVIRVVLTMVALGLFLFVAVLLVLAYFLNVPGWLWNYYRQLKYLKSVPSYPMHWLLGHLLMIRKLDQETLDEVTSFIQKERLKVSVMWLGPFFAHVDVLHPELVNNVLKVPKSRPVYKMLMPWLGEGLLIADGDKWYRNRRLLTPAFHFQILKPYVSVYNSCLEVMLKKWSESVRVGESVELFDTVSLMSLDVVLRCALSFRSDCQDVNTKHPYIKAVCDMVQLSTDRFMNPFYHSDWIYYLTPSGCRTRKACKVFHDYSSAIIQERKKVLGLENQQEQVKKATEHDTLLKEVTKTRKYLDFLDILLTTVDEEGKGLSDREIRDEVDTFMFEGHDTTTSGISWTLYCLAKYSEHQAKVREEVQNVLMGRDRLEYDDLKDLKYTQWCIKEAMRLYPPVFQVYRRCSEDMELDGHLIPKDTQIGIFTYIIHHHPDVWENPEEFNPLRFHPSNAEKRHPYAYIPFSAGPRNCIGQYFAMNEERLVVGTIVNRFALSLVEGHTVEVVPRVVLRAKYGIKINLQPIT